MRKPDSKVILACGVGLLVYASLVVVDLACIPSLAFCQFYEPFSPW